MTGVVILQQKGQRSRIGSTDDFSSAEFAKRLADHKNGGRSLCVNTAGQLLGIVSCSFHRLRQRFIASSAACLEMTAAQFMTSEVEIDRDALDHRGAGHRDDEAEPGASSRGARRRAKLVCLIGILKRGQGR